ncbi:universal stress protein [Streptomyces misionensis]|uniref:Universal stress protein n=1 Tax=Streptomyces misionensis TaxID=67331 RepID=A0A5C6K305_9ACTN|nr:universal stress protein [Streptomyces misionensis]TWV56746.1 universal stress protein [Streptomyces misionensis]
MPLPLVVGVDGSDTGLLAVDWAADEAVRLGLPLRIVHASLWERYEDLLPSLGEERPAPRVMAEHIVATAAERAGRRAPNLDIGSVVLAEDPVAALLAEGDNATALVTGSRGRGGLKSLLLGSVALAVAGRARGPVIVVRGDAAGTEGTHDRVLLGVGEPGAAATAARFAVREAAARRCVLDAVRAWRRTARAAVGRDDADEAAAAIDELLGPALAGQPGVRVSRTVLEGPPGKVLLHRSAAADLLVVGVRREHGRGGLQLGRVTHRLLHHALCPVAVVPRLP